MNKNRISIAGQACLLWITGSKPRIKVLICIEVNQAGAIVDVVLTDPL
jgi:hypothetical protein